MWDRPAQLNLVANLLYALAAALALVGAGSVVAHLPLFPLREVVLSGPVRHTSQEQVSSLVREQLRGNFFTVDLEQTRRAFERLPWVRHASLRRRWPDRLEVELEEHVALARWHDDALVNSQGELFRAAAASALPLFLGPVGTQAEMARRHGEFLTLLAPLHRVPAELRLSDRGAWEMKLDDGYVLALGRQEMAPRLARFVAVFAATLARLPPGSYRVDLRYPNGFAVSVPGLHWNARDV